MHIIVRQEGTKIVASSSPTVYLTYTAAEEEAKLLARNNPSMIFLIMYCCATVKQEVPPLPPIRVTQLFLATSPCYN